ncbi:MAG: sensor histidine kinase [Myxococcales bacterium]|nr:sensor histidine kinase [Myxococcales bacterium]
MPAPAFLSFLDEPRPVAPRGVLPRDVALVLALVAAVLLESTLRAGIDHRLAHAVHGVALVLPLLARRAHPLRALGSAFALASLVPLGTTLSGQAWTDLHTTAAILLLPYTLLRWGSGREALVGLVVVAALYVVSLAGGRFRDLESAVGAAVVMAFPALLGVTVRLRASARLRQLDAARMAERAEIARELHDSVAHHLSAIALQAQGGILVAEARPADAVKVLHVVEDVASKALDELRTMVRALRADAAPALAPQHTLADLAGLADGATDELQVTVEVLAEASDVPRPVQAAVYRIAYEGVTNARRHAVGAAHVDVIVRAADRSLTVAVVDDGEGRASRGRGGLGLGLVGVAERAEMLGGRLDAGPLPGRGFRVEATFPLRKGGR